MSKDDDRIYGPPRIRREVHKESAAEERLDDAMRRRVWGYVELVDMDPSNLAQTLEERLLRAVNMGDRRAIRHMAQMFVDLATACGHASQALDSSSSFEDQEEWLSEMNQAIRSASRAPC